MCSSRPLSSAPYSGSLGDRVAPGLIVTCPSHRFQHEMLLWGGISGTELDDVISVRWQSTSRRLMLLNPAW